MTPEQWLKTPGLERALLVKVNYLHNGSKTAYFSTHPFVSSPTDSPAHTPFDDLVVSTPRFSRKNEWCEW